MNLIRGNAPSLVVGGRVFTDLANLIALVGVTITSNRYQTLRKSDGTAAYQVPVGKRFDVLACRTLMRNNTASVFAAPYLLYGDTAVEDSATEPTNPIYTGGFNGAEKIVHGLQMPIPVASYGMVFLQADTSIKFSIPAQKYPCMVGGYSGSSITFYGYEVSV